MKKLLVLFGLLLILFSCRSSKDFYNKHGQLKNISDLRLLKSTIENYTDFNTLFLKKFKAEVEFNGESKAFKGNLFLTKDSDIIISINPMMGIELFRVRLSKSNVELLDRTKRNYLTGNYDFLWNKFMLDLDYEIIQGIILNQLYAYPTSDETNDALKKYKHTISNEMYAFQSIKDGRSARLDKRQVKKDLVLHEFYIMPEVFKIKRSYIKDYNSNSQVDIVYDKFYETDKGLYPTKLSITGMRELNSFKITLSFDDVEYDGEGSLGFKISSKYSKRNLNEL